MKHLNAATTPGSRRGWLAALLGSLLLAFAAGCDRDRAETPPMDSGIGTLEFRSVKPARQDVLRKVVLPASVRADLEVTLFSKVSRTSPRTGETR